MHSGATAWHQAKKGASAGLGQEDLLLLQSFANGLHGPLFVGELARLELGVDQIAVDGQLEAAAPFGDQRQLFDLLLVRGQQLARQTDGLRLVVSHRAVLEFHVHGCASSDGPVRPNATGVGW